MPVRVERESKDEVLASRLLEGSLTWRPEVKISLCRLQITTIHFTSNGPQHLSDNGLRHSRLWRI